MRNMCNVHMPQAICDVISGVGISIGIGAAAADSIGYRAPARYWPNPNLHVCPLHSVKISITSQNFLPTCSCIVLLLKILVDIILGQHCTIPRQQLSL